jgi:major membrane immunogen (membrane-anchored lipoprotein)
MEKVMNVFNGFLENKFKSQKSISSSQSYEESKDNFRSDDALAKKKEDLKDAMGPSVFNFYYDYLYKARTNPQTDEAQVRQQLKEMVGSNKELKNLIFSLE